MIRTWTNRVSLAAAAAVGLMAGCAGSSNGQSGLPVPSQPAETRPPPAAHALTAGARLETAIAAGALNYVGAPIGDDAEPLRGRLTVTWEREPDRPDTFFRRFVHEGAVIRQDRIVRLDDGALAISEQIDHKESVEVRFEPPLVILPASIVPSAETFEQSVRMVVHPLGSRFRVKAQGRAIVRISLSGKGRWVRTPQGDVAVSVLDSEFVAELGPSKVSSISVESFDVSGRLVEFKRAESTTALGVPIRNNREAWSLEE